MPCRLFSATKALVTILFDLFSVKQIFPTLFAPWKRDIISYEGLSFQEKFNVFMLNMASRLIGCLIKSFVLITFILVLILSLVISFFVFVVWLAFPIVVIFLIVLGLFNIFSNNT